MSAPGATLSDSLEPGSAKPTGLRPVLDVIPAHCYERSLVRGLGLVLRDVVVYGLAVWGLLSTNSPLLLVPLWLLAGLAVSGLFVLGHDAAHDALFDSPRLNAAVARLTMLPALHAVEVWVYGHNRVHHGHTLRQGMDFVWQPLTVEEYRALGPLGRLVQRVEWGPFGAGFYYVHRVWWQKMVRFPAPPRWRTAMRRDQALIAAFCATTLVLAVAGAGPAGLWIWIKVIVIPFLLFSQVIGWVVYVHHIAPDIRWWPRNRWNRYRGQVEGTTVLWGPPGWDLFLHWIMVHLPHHVDMRIPCYRLPEAARAIAAAFPDDVVQRPILRSGYLHSVRVCKLYDFDHGRWLRVSEVTGQAAEEPRR